MISSTFFVCTPFIDDAFAAARCKKVTVSLSNTNECEEWDGNPSQSEKAAWWASSNPHMGGGTNPYGASSGGSGKAGEAVEQAEKMSSFVTTLMQEAYNLISATAKVFHDVAGSIFKICALLAVFLFGVHAVLARASIEDMIKDFCLWLLWACICYTAIIHFETWSHWLFDLENEFAEGEAYFCDFTMIV